ncbi:thiol-disulfide isomerase/thioredoxin [Deinobacterium chartae]|uniref:Thiol-disulfide isomerase/thioredoxin n=1 Tax=Deinobacterium chartae TaxID=521158 RepID=A0A841I312_9DEIO|nr:TlpA family protein disulfide reductase [Deinobacterium chartae]MBB6098759.1 thiol-disulfide isomerase/thioredoxin [Deinobacterium chartae]
MWPSAEDYVWGEMLPAPERWDRPGVVMFFNVECAGCVSRGIPFLKRLTREYAGRLHVLAVHTARGHRRLPRADVEPTVRHFAERFAKLPFPVTLDLEGELAEYWGTEGTPHWLVFGAGGELLRSLYGSQENAQTRLEYLLAEQLGAADA